MSISKERTVALVDDDKIFQFTASRMIRSLGITERILQFENGEDALRFLADNAMDGETLPDYIFLDINMPFVDGWMFLEEFGKISASMSKKISVFMVSSSIDPRDIQRARSIPEVSEYITKPVPKEKFVDLLK